MDKALFDLPKVECAGEALQSLCHGQAISVLNAPESGRLRIYSDSGEFIGIGTVLEDGRIAPKRLIII
jgi:tRNA pseudouridine55 synthase